MLSSNLPLLMRRIVDGSPSDIRLLAQRLQDHTIERRMPPDEVTALVQSMGFDGLTEFCAKVGLPPHVAKRWSQFGVSSEMSLVLTFLASQRRDVAAAASDFDAWNHVGLEDFLRDRELL